MATRRRATPSGARIARSKSDSARASPRARDPNRITASGWIDVAIASTTRLSSDATASLRGFFHLMFASGPASPLGDVPVSEAWPCLGSRPLPCSNLASASIGILYRPPGVGCTEGSRPAAIQLRTVWLVTSNRAATSETG